MRGDKEITNSADILDSRDIINRIGYLEKDYANHAQDVITGMGLYDLAIQLTEKEG